MAEQGAAAERPIDEDGHAAFRTQRQQPGFGGAPVDRVGELHEVDALGADDGRQLVQRGIGVVRDADVAEFLPLLPGAQRAQMRAPVDEVVDLHEVDCWRLQLGGGGLHLRDAGRLAGGPHLGGEERAVVRFHFGEQVADDRLGAPVHGRGVDHLAAGLEQNAQHLLALIEARALGADIEGLPGTQPDDGQRLIGLGDRACQHGRPRLRCHSGRVQ